jgi:hypothetical protein
MASTPKRIKRRSIGVAFDLRLDIAERKVRRARQKLLTQITRQYAKGWLIFYRFKHVLGLRAGRHGFLAVSLLLVTAIAASSFGIPQLQRWMLPIFDADSALGNFRSLLLTLGGSILGAVAIVSSLVLFALQVNIERVPDGLFRRLSADAPLMLAFGATFALAITVSLFSLIPNTDWLAVTVYCCGWAILVTGFLFVFSYRRALQLISPSEQLKILTKRSASSLRRWMARARRARPLMENTEPQYRRRSATAHDMSKLAYLRLNPQWTFESSKGIQNAVAYVRRYGEHGDYEVSATALNAIIEINADYARSKKGTFVAHNEFMDTPLSNDSFIDDTLLRLNETAQVAIARQDQRHLRQILQAMAKLSQVYASIEYGSQLESKFHSHLALRYLLDNTKSILKTDMVEAMLEGVRRTGDCGKVLIQIEGAQGFRFVLQDLTVIAAATLLRESHRPVAMSCVSQMALFSIGILTPRDRARGNEVDSAAGDIRDAVTQIGKMVMMLPDAGFMQIHVNVMAGYYSFTSVEAVPVRLTSLVNAAVQEPSTSAAARDFLTNLADWSDGLNRTEQELLLHAIQHRSLFAITLLQWIAHAIELFLSAATAPACRSHDADELRDRARDFAAIISWIPRDQAAVDFAQSLQVDETLFRVARVALRFQQHELAEEVWTMLSGWVFESAQHRSGFSDFEPGLYGLAVLAFEQWGAQAGVRLDAEIARRLATPLPDQARVDRAAMDMRRTSERLGLDRFSGSFIEHALHRGDRNALAPLLVQIADRISPTTVGQQSRTRF